MDLHVFNPEHDIALAFNRRHLTMPHAAQELRMNLGWIPALWASDGDAVLVDDIPYAVKAALRCQRKADVLFVSWDDLSKLPIDHVNPWGWDLTLRTALAEHGVAEQLLPTEDNLQEIRKRSSRVSTIPTISFLRDGLQEQTCGQARYHESLDTLLDTLAAWQRVVLKAPWSSSGRGVRYVDGEMNPSVKGWAQRVIQQQGGVMAEPFYNKVKDFGMEFFMHENGTVEYAGLSLFHTVNNVYTGNLLASEEVKRNLLDKWIPSSLTDTVIERIRTLIPSLLHPHYAGPFGIDMMVVARHDQQGYLLHPCVEINLRRTMGHVALALTPQEGQAQQLMSIEHNVNYFLEITTVD